MSSYAPDPVTLHEPLTSPAALRALLGEVYQGNLNKVKPRLDAHCRQFISHAPLVFISSANRAGQCDVSPKGDVPGFVHALSDTQLAIPDRKGNRRADTLLNILDNPQVGLLFLIPGMTETLRVNGVASLYTDPDLLDALTLQGKRPQVAMVVETREVYLHCGRSLLRAHLWNPETWPPLEVLPSAAHMFADHMAQPDLTCDDMEAVLDEAYHDLY
ncbi:MAG TPA: MSMEG_1061 family FMN-dependent PPOX-type flavoprotein [Ktedonobacterales bacterium]|nr:MSMEG_1061 family FMN-dependent PPOX-type flavoprotein [Ktedonobacterales bacterium]